jgi:hypothetical protein
MNPQMRRNVILGVVLLVAVAGVAWWRYRPEPALEQAYIRGRNISAWNRLAQVREAVATLRYGELVAVLERRGESVRIRTAQGAVGWVAERNLMPAESWQKAAQLVEQARAMPVQARGRTKVLSNIRAEPGREAPRIIQVSAGISVDVLARAVAEWKPASGEDDSRVGNVPAKKETGPRREDWALVRASDAEAGEIAGWVLGRFLEPDLPDPLRDLGAGIHWMAWFELDRISDADRQKGQFLGVGVTGPEGQPCDFTLLRVYTWSLARHRYETAYVESNLCGKLPIRIVSGGAEKAFSFSATGRAGREQREYRFRQNIVRRLRAGR